MTATQTESSALTADECQAFRTQGYLGPYLVRTDAEMATVR